MVLFIKKNKKHFLRYFTKISILFIIFGFLGSLFVPFLSRQSVTPVRAAVQNYTVNFATSIEGFTYVNEGCTGTCTQGYFAADGNPSGSLYSKVTARNKKNLGYFKKTLTWEDMGVPVGATINNVDGRFDVKLFQETYAAIQSVGLKIYDDTDTVIVFDGGVDLETEFDPTSSSWSTRDVDGAKTVSSAYQASNTGITMRMRSDVNSGNNNSASTEVRMDTLVFNIDYTLAAANPDATSFINNTDGTLVDGGRSSQQITITGTSFGVDPGVGNRSTATNNIKIGGSGGYQILDADISSWSDTQIVFTIPAACTSYGGLTNSGLLVTAGGTADPTPLTFYVYPNITGVGASKTVGDTTATITGDHLGTTRTMTVNGASATIGGGSTETSITFTVPDTISGTVIVSITAPITKTSNNNQNFQVLPKVTAISTISGDSGSTYSGISLTGSGFQSVSSVTLTLGTQTVTGSGFTLSNKNSITGGLFNLNNATPGPTAAYAGIWNVNLTTTDAIFGASPTTYASSFTVRPKIITPTPTEALQGATITISGYGFGTAGTLYINTNGTAITESTPGVTWTNTSISGVSVPSDATINTGGMSITVGAVQNSPVYGFIVLPQITSLSVTEGRVGDTITINGNHLGSSAGTISINGASATGTWGDTSITGVAIPAAGTIDGSVTITTNATYGTKTSNGITFKILPRITSTTPATGTGARIGDVVVINGDHFGPAGAITLDGQNSSTGVTYTDTSISNFTIPNTISSGQSLNFVVTRSSDSKTSNSYAFKILPRVTSPLSPTEGRVGDSLTISGDHFGGAQGTGSVLVGSTSATVTSWGDTSITVNVPNDTGTTVAVQVTRNGGDTSNNNITFTILPQVTSITQTEGRVGDTITVNGNHFGAVRGAGTVTFGSTIAPSGDYVSWNAGTIQVKIQNDSSYNLAIKVTRDDTKISNIDKTILILPQITSIVPTDVLVGDTVTISGNHFGAAKGASGKVTMGITDVAGGDYLSWGDNSLQVKVPNDSGGTIAVVVTRDGDLKTSNNDKTVSILPQITSITQTEGRVGDTIIINGNHFGAVRGNGYVAFGSTNAPAGDHVSWNDTTIQVKVQNDSGYTVSVKVTRDDTKSSNTDKNILILPRITSVTAEARVGGSITVTGDHFGAQGASSQVTVGSTTAIIGTWNEGSITATVPNDAGYTVVVAARRHSDLKDSNNDKTMLILPRVTSVTSESRVGSSVTVTGDHFGNQGANSKVTFGSTDGSIGIWGENSVDVTVPNDSGTTVSIIVTRHSDTKTSNSDITMIIIPQLSSINVTEGRVGDTITLTGNHFGASRGTGKVTFGLTDAPSGDYVSWGANSIQVKIQNDAGYTVAVKVTRDDTKTSNTDKTILILPQITSTNPNSGRVGTVVQINGNHFGPNPATVTIDGQNSSTSVTWGENTITNFTVPSGIGSGTSLNFLATRDDGKNSNTYAFAILANISSVTSEARVGDTITISGDHFGGVQGAGKVTVGTTDVTTGLTWSDTSIALAIPNDSGTTVTIVVTRNDATASNNDKTIIILPRITSTTPAAATGARIGDIVTISGDHFGAVQGGGTARLDNQDSSTAITWASGSIGNFTIPNTIGSGQSLNFVITRSDSKTSNNYAFTILARITSVTSEARVGDTITISGDHFGAVQGGGKVTVGTTDVSSGLTWSDTSITLALPNDAGITVAVVVTRNDTKTSNNDVTMIILPQISSINVTEGRVGDTITLTGNHFGSSRGTGKVTFGTTDAPPGDYVSWGASSIQVKIQNDAGYTVAIKVTRDDTKTSNTDKTILILPQITSVTSEARVGDSVTISGNHFGATQGAGKITIGTTDVSSGLTWSATSVSLNLPNDSGIAVAVVVTRDDAKTSNNNYTLIILPKVTSVTSEARVGDTITIAGDHFGAVQGGGKVTVGTTDVTAGLTWGATSISLALPNDSGITVAVVVTRDDTKISNNDKTLLILPRITGLNNAVTSNSSYQGDIITIIGDHFGSNGSVVINGEPATINGSYGASGGTQITNVVVPVIPDGNEAGNIVVTRTNPAPDKNTNNWSFTCLPKIISVDVTASSYGTTVENGVTSARYEDTLRINGNHFGAQGANSRIMFGSTVASIGSWSTTTIETTAPNDPGYSVSLVVRRHSDSANSNNYSFDYLPRVTGFTCSGSGCTTGVAGGFSGGGTLVSVNGDHFRPDPGAGNRSSASYNIKFNDFNGNPLLTPNGDFDSWSETQVRVYIPSGASSGPVNYAARIQVTANSKTSNLDASHTRFDIKPKITGINPNTAENSNPVTVTITGEGFQPKTASTDSRLMKTGQSDIIAANGDIIVSSATSMSAIYNITNKSAGYWKLTVTNPEGYIAEWGDGSVSGFYVSAAVPTVTGVDPTEGTQNDTALQLTITGENFVNLSSPKCYLSGPTQINADTVYEDSATQIRCVVNLSSKPIGQYSINVKNQAGVGTLSNGFTILSNVPANPSDLIQSKTQGGAALSPESGVNQTNVWFHTDMYSAVAGGLTPEIELKPNGVPFDGNGLILGALVSYLTPKTTVDGWVQATVANGNEYHWRIRVKNANGDSAWVNFGGDPINSKDFYCDTVAPTITGISTSGVSDVSTTINWSVNEDATKQVEYNTTGSWPGTLQPNPTSGYSVGAQAVTITGLSPSTTYYFRVKAIDKAGNEAICGNSVNSPTNCAENGSFVTLATRPLKTVELFIGQDTETRTSGNGILGGFAFNIYIPEGNPTIKSAFFEITGVSGTANPLAITTDIDSANQKVFNLSTGNNSYFKTYYDATSHFYGIINAGGTYPATDAYHLNIVGNGGDVSLWGAKLTLTYTYSP